MWRGSRLRLLKSGVEMCRLMLVEDEMLRYDEMELETAKINSSRLVERLSQFDARTNKMADGWYLKFADVRRGSFLPRASGRQKQNSETAEWKERCKKRGRLPAKDRMTWQRLSPTSVIFLHWIGFDPMSALSPPNEEATQALGYLAYDFFGKIVEKVCLPCAIFFYNSSSIYIMYRRTLFCIRNRS